MKKAFCVVTGVFMFTFIGFLVSSGLSRLYEKSFAQSQDDMDRFSVLLLVIVMPLFSLMGGKIAAVIYKKYPTKH